MSQNIIYTSIPQLMTSCGTLLARIEAIRSILSNMELLMAMKDDTQQYKLDTTQTRIEKTYMNFSELQKAYQQLFQMEQMMVVRYNIGKTGRVRRLIDSKNFIGPGRFPFTNWNS